MPDLVRQEVANAADVLIVKVGTRVLTRADGKLNLERVAGLAEELAEIFESGRKVALVSSGAVGAGMGQLGLSRRPTGLADLQAVAAVGQSHLIETYDHALRAHGLHAAQVLLTIDDLHDRARYLNFRNTVHALWDYRAVPIINENDTVSVDELQMSFGDNDRLAAEVTNLLRAPLLVLLSDVAGLYDRDPSEADARVISTVDNLTDEVMSLARDKTTGLSKGGMASKLRAAKIATSAGEHAIIAGGKEPGALRNILAGEAEGTLFLPRGASVKSRKRWISSAAQVRGALELDEGACRAIANKGRSLLAIGIVGIEGDFTKGDVVALRCPKGRELARGLSNYTAEEVRLICGKKTTQIAAILGHCPYDEVIHRDNLALIG